jgi:HEAT repeat protein
MRTIIVTLLAAALGSAGLRAEIPSALSAALDSPQTAVRLQTVRSLAVDYPKESLPQMLRAVTDTDPLVRERAVQALGVSGGPENIATLQGALDDPVWYVRWRSLQALKQLGARDIWEWSGALAEDESWQVRVSLYELAGDILAGTLRKATSEKQPESPARVLLVRGLSDKDERVRLAAAGALARNHDTAALEPLLGLLKGGSLFTRDGAALALGVLGDVSAVPALIEALTDPRNEASDEGHDWARWGAAKALTVLSGMDFGLDEAKWREWMEAGHERK